MNICYFIKVLDRNSIGSTSNSACAQTANVHAHRLWLLKRSRVLYKNLQIRTNTSIVEPIFGYTSPKKKIAIQPVCINNFSNFSEYLQRRFQTTCRLTSRTSMFHVFYVVASESMIWYVRPHQQTNQAIAFKIRLLTQMHSNECVFFSKTIFMTFMVLDAHYNVYLFRMQNFQWHMYLVVCSLYCVYFLFCFVLLLVPFVWVVARVKRYSTNLNSMPIMPIHLFIVSMIPWFSFFL